MTFYLLDGSGNFLTDDLGNRLVTEDTIQLSASITEANDSVSSAVTVLVSVSATITEANDQLSAGVGNIVLISAVITEASDALSATVSVEPAGTITAQLNITEANDVLSAIASTKKFRFHTRGEVVYVDLVTSTTRGSIPSASSGYGFSLLFNMGEKSPPGTVFTASLISPRGEQKLITNSTSNISLGTSPVKTGGWLPAGAIMLPYEYVLYQTSPDDFNVQGIWKVAMTSGTDFSRYGSVRIAP